jgi:hypothetical protein
MTHKSRSASAAAIVFGTPEYSQKVRVREAKRATAHALDALADALDLLTEATARSLTAQIEHDNARAFEIDQRNVLKRMLGRLDK